ncbi:hypothetical protein [Aurantiacibacter luteus]|uniref:Uncharacterized protein n=1 Tax=Aurantiacibacter luteus TaxID=1581420 RepID=A0A0G9MUA3_9SPHN|nr:hypothetical protein [Aurantiacibacter luteus]KLE34129.1 hypothetical protein AAW00_07555 [Aurantiacibacter luteus]
MADPAPSGSKTKWLWLLVVILLGVLLVFVLVSPSGDRDGDVDDPIAVPAGGQPTADTALEDVAEGDSLSEASNADPVEPSDLPPAPAVDPLPSE